MKTPPTEWENSFVNNASDKGLISKTTTNQLKNGQKPAIDIFQREHAKYAQYAQKVMKICSILLIIIYIKRK